MELASNVALVLLTLTGYSAGVALGARNRIPVPGLLDLMVIVLLWVGAISTRATLGRWLAIGVWVLIGLMVGLMLAYARRTQYTKAEHNTPAANLWQAWKVFARRMGNYQGRVFMALLYFTVVLPFGAVATFLGDPLGIKRKRSASNWQPKQMSTKPSIEEAGRQY
ncbi:MAG: hypothetical protein NZ765_01280 [Anaerolineae bacterium]|nr:hypothetical protein [Anaerolineae bacterium]MDW8070594.1 hypothetical protein [Anaerolineae bacterium]